MGVRKKGRRKIICDDKRYIWYVEMDCDSPYNILNIVSEDKTLIIACPLKMETPYIISKGNMFQNQIMNGLWTRYLLPFKVPQIITPKFVSELILWGTQGENAVEVKWNGENIFI